MNDELTKAVVGELKKVAQLVAARVQIGAWSDATYETPETFAETIIALVRADERRRLREALLSDETLNEVCEAQSYMYPGDSYEVISAVLAAIGLSESEVAE